MIPFESTAGEKNRRAKLTDQIVAHLRASWARKPPGMTQREFCEDWGALFDVRRETVRDVVTKKNWT